MTKEEFLRMLLAGAVARFGHPLNDDSGMILRLVPLTHQFRMSWQMRPDGSVDLLAENILPAGSLDEDLSHESAPVPPEAKPKPEKPVKEQLTLRHDANSPEEDFDEEMDDLAKQMRADLTGGDL